MVERARIDADAYRNAYSLCCTNDLRYTRMAADIAGV